ncbi:MAG TPA: hypothetical protein VFS49_03645 [Croceibacterium sp.]|nr:hypothetical protein [Croceibacterium sp.]
MRLERDPRFAIKRSMREPSITTSRFAIAGGLLAAIALAAAGFVVGRTTALRPVPDEPVTVSKPTPAPPPEADGVLGRAELIGLADRAADALASGEAARGPIAAAEGQRFALVLPFGCSGPNDDGPPMRWRYDVDNEALRITVEPVRWTPDQWGLGGPGPGSFEVAEGFWIARPWSTGEACPPSGAAAPPDTQAVTLPGQTLAIAQFFAVGANRDARRDGQPYEAVKRVPADSFDGSRGFRLRVSGRIADVPGRGLVHCMQPAGPEQRPVCVIGARIDEVAIEDPRTGDVIASWPLESSG